MSVFLLDVLARLTNNQCQLALKLDVGGEIRNANRRFRANDGRRRLNEHRRRQRFCRLLEHLGDVVSVVTTNSDDLRRQHWGEQTYVGKRPGTASLIQLTERVPFDFVQSNFTAFALNEREAHALWVGDSSNTHKNRVHVTLR